MFNFTARIDSEIAQLQAKLAELESRKHRVSTCANRIVEQAGECVLEMKGMGVSDKILTNWARIIYKEITGQDIEPLLDKERDELEKLNQANAKGLADLSQANFKLCEELNNPKSVLSEITTTEVYAKRISHQILSDDVSRSQERR